MKLPMTINNDIKKISVVMCTYNGEKYIQQQLDSILNQTYPIFEIIIQDDNSTDNTYKIIEDYASKKTGIMKVFRNKSKSGYNNNFFSAIKRATGEYIAISDQDDVWETDKLELQVQTIRDHLLCSGLSIPFSTDGTPIRVDTRIPNHSLFRLIYVGDSMPGHTLFFHKSLLTLLPDISAINQIRSYDVILSMVAASYESIAFVEKKLVNHRMHLNAATYSCPINNTRNLQNAFRYVRTAFIYYKVLKDEIRRRLQIEYDFLSRIDSSNQTLKSALRLLELQNSKKIKDRFKLVLFLYNHQSYLFYAYEEKSVINSIRAFLFPITCSYYFQHLIKSKGQRN